MEGESGVTRSIIDQIHSWDIQANQMEAESGGTRSIIDELRSSDIKGNQKKVKVMLLERSMMHFILWISKEIKRKLKVVLLEVS